MTKQKYIVEIESSQLAEKEDISQDIKEELINLYYVLNAKIEVKKQ